ncbi:hypothetical protein B7P34_16725 [Streptosporangium nondiastaticum]|uniref:Uncharacterized protein n=1 Tax=Streptosporangium nondiastaticum TaxID=35764 RepID=A0A9X7PH22_9ACTN|nr:hypothetical protein [Streptosporangium nondiastaticum]PSJ27623.1 hypothetical protein B7P34_16725 [Streptosporangium nondiastaticum]
MGRLQDKWLGTRYPDNDVVPLSAAEVRNALLTINGPRVPFRIRDAGPTENADVVAEWWFRTTGLDDDMPRRQEEHRLRIRMRLDPSGREVRFIQEKWSSAGGGPHMQHAYRRGRSFTVEWKYERGPDGRRRKVTTLDTRDVKRALQKATLSSGWIWRGVSQL